MLHQPLDVYPLIGPATIEELDNCLGALDVELSPGTSAGSTSRRSPLASLRRQSECVGYLSEGAAMNIDMHCHILTEEMIRLFQGVSKTYAPFLATTDTPYPPA